MDQNRPEANPQQNVHLHMHHVCSCQGLYPAATYYPAMSYRNPLIPYAAPQAVARPYLQHYQYTQFNMGGQYGVPMAQMAYGGASSHQGSDTAIALARKERGDSQDSAAPDLDRAIPEPPADFDFGPIIPPISELFFASATEDQQQMNTDGFIKFLERSCLTAEQIAYRNRNRPCFRNIQNLCIRTRSEILKPRTTISNIHSQGIPWATKDFIYAFVRLTNCWHIMKGYWENRDGSALGKIAKELTPGFKACYVRWEKETVELATELTRTFYNLDVNQSNPAPNVHTANNLVPSQVSLLKNEIVVKKSDVLTKNAGGILHLPGTADQGNQTCSGDFVTRSDGNGSEEENVVVYMKPGSYRVPKNPRVIEFLETAQNINKGLEAANDKYWIRMKTVKKVEEPEIDDVEVLLASEAFFNVHEWLSNSNFSDCEDVSSVSSSLPPPPSQPSFLLEESKKLQKNGIVSRTYRRKQEAAPMVYELKNGGLTKKAKSAIEKMLFELKGTDLALLLSDSVMDGPSLNIITKNFNRDCYRYVNEIVRDLRFLANAARQQVKQCDLTAETIASFCTQLDSCLIEYFPNCEFGAIVGNRGEKVGKLKLKKSFFEGDVKNAS